MAYNRLRVFNISHIQCIKLLYTTKAASTVHHSTLKNFSRQMNLKNIKTGIICPFPEAPKGPNSIHEGRSRDRDWIELEMSF